MHPYRVQGSLNWDLRNCEPSWRFSWSERRLSKGLRTRAHKALVTVLKASRDEAGLTQRDLADRLGKPRSYISKIESGERIPRITEFCDIAQALKLEPELLFQRFWRWR